MAISHLRPRQTPKGQPGQQTQARKTQARQTQVKPNSQISPTQGRLKLVGLFLALGGLGILVRLIYLQAYQGQALEVKANSRQQEELRQRVIRYPIFDRRGVLLAADKPTFILYAHPEYFKEKQLKGVETWVTGRLKALTNQARDLQARGLKLEVQEAQQLKNLQALVSARQKLRTEANLTSPGDLNLEIAFWLAPILNRPPAELATLFRSQATGIPVSRNLDENSRDQISQLQFDGLDFEPTWERLYPQAGLTAGIVGYVDHEHLGQAGLEYQQPRLLQANQQPTKLTRDAQGRLLPDHAQLNPRDPSLEPRVRLTIDTRLQRVVRTALQQQLAKFNAKGGTTLVMDVKTGALLALVTEPSFNPNDVQAGDIQRFRNWAVADLYEPGSTFKPINVAIALEAKAITPNDSLPDEGRIIVDGWPINNADNTGRGMLSIADVLGYSSNIGMVHMMDRVQPSVYYDFLKRLGLGKEVGSDLPFETAGQLRDREEFVNSRIARATTAFGQGVSTTPLQVAQLTAAVVNGGKLVIPHVIDGVYDHNNQLMRTPSRPPVRQVFSPATSAAVVKMLGHVVTEGTGKAAQIPGYRLGGKTGTAQKPLSNGRGYGSYRITSFAGVFPLENPRYVVLTVVDEPKGDNAYGSTVALPVVRSVIESLITIEAIPPSHPEELLAPRPAPSP